MEELREIFERVTEHYSTPVKIGSRCVSNIYYSIEDIVEDELARCADYLAERIFNTCSPEHPDLLVQMKGNRSGLCDALARALSFDAAPLEQISLEQLFSGGNVAARIKGVNIVLVNDVITTAKTCLEVHSQATLLGGRVLCWAALIDRTFGPGPVPVVATFTGAPVTLLNTL